jgi:transposase
MVADIISEQVAGLDRNPQRELKERGYAGSYTAVTDFLRDVRPPPRPGYEVRFETPPGEQGQVDFAQFQVVFTDEPETPRVVWLFSMVLGFSRLIWARFVVHRTWRRCCAVMWRLSRLWAARRGSYSTTA